MPIPNPIEGENHDTFMSRCMRVLSDDHPDRDERYAICQSRWDEKRGDGKMAMKAYGDTEGPLGLPMKDEVARYVEDVLKGLPADCKELVAKGPVRTSAGAKIVMEHPELEPRTEVAFVGTDSVDRDREVMLPKGGVFDQWKKNPVVTWAHQYDVLPLGRGKWIKRAKKGDVSGILAKSEYITKPEDWQGDWFADAVLHYVAEGFMPGRSVGFIPLEMRPPSEKEIKARPELAGVNRIIPKWLLLEYAVCPVQSNPDALVELAAKGLKMPADMDTLYGVALPEVTMLGKESIRIIGDDEEDDPEPEVTPEDETQEMPAPVPAAEAEEDDDAKTKYECECIKCGHKATIEGHCKDTPCPECGGTMRRAERPGPGQPVDETPKSTIRVVATPDSEDALRYRTPDQIADETVQAGLQADVDIDAIVEETLARMSGRLE